MADQVATFVRDCACPGEPHKDSPGEGIPAGDVVYILPTLGLEGGLEAEQDFEEVQRMYPMTKEQAKDPAFLADVAAKRTRWLRPRWYRTFLQYGAVGWNLLDADGDPVPFDLDALINDYSLGKPVADAASDRYSKQVMAPFLPPPPKDSRNGQTDGGTPQPKTPTPLRSKRSSRGASAGGASSAA